MRTNIVYSHFNIYFSIYWVGINLFVYVPDFVSMQRKHIFYFFENLRPFVKPFTTDLKNAVEPAKMLAYTTVRFFGSRLFDRNLIEKEYKRASFFIKNFLEIFPFLSVKVRREKEMYLMSDYKQRMKKKFGKNFSEFKWKNKFRNRRNTFFIGNNKNGNQRY